MKFLETSAKTSHNVSESFVTMTKEIISINSEKEKLVNKNDPEKDQKMKLKMTGNSKNVETGSGCCK